MAALAVTAEDVASWLTPAAALRIATVAFGDEEIARAAILERLRGGQIAAAAENSAWEGMPGVSTTPHVWIEVIHWTHIVNQTSLSHFWVTGQIRIYHRHFHRRDEVTIRFFGVRLDPAGVQAMIASAPQKPSAQASQIDNFTPALSQAELQAYGYRSAATGGQAEAAQEKGPPVSEQHLKAWFDLYKQVYQGAADTEANALKSAAGMFPGKLVSRDRVRALRGAQKRGRKPNEPAK